MFLIIHKSQRNLYVTNLFYKIHVWYNVSHFFFKTPVIFSASLKRNSANMLK